MHIPLHVSCLLMSLLFACAWWALKTRCIIVHLEASGHAAHEPGHNNGEWDVKLSLRLKSLSKFRDIQDSLGACCCVSLQCTSLLHITWLYCWAASSTKDDKIVSLCSSGLVYCVVSNSTNFNFLGEGVRGYGHSGYPCYRLKTRDEL